MDEAGVKCIPEHTGFKANCLHPDVIEVSFYEFLDVNGPIGDEEPIHEVYRYIAYRRLARWFFAPSEQEGLTTSSVMRCGSHSPEISV
ncbi:hypothetical protein DPMN_028593 [Dreissena polymorpha]|uniref:Uncharacterized protein n=1 Tax=Dreissena polymorpha TaxID=45954 RepID=A0A9D4LVP8_DREPO|nr:hypothetical protein DPMN_028593 [Dreissena polymorpha]